MTAEWAKEIVTDAKRAMRGEIQGEELLRHMAEHAAGERSHFSVMRHVGRMEDAAWVVANSPSQQAALAVAWGRSVEYVEQTAIAWGCAAKVLRYPGKTYKAFNATWVAGLRDALAALRSMHA